MSDDSDTDSSSQSFERNPGILVTSREFSATTEAFKESDDDRAPIYASLPSGVRANRFLMAGLVTRIERRSNDGDAWVRATIRDAVGNIYISAGQYQPDVKNYLLGLIDDEQAEEGFDKKKDETYEYQEDVYEPVILLAKPNTYEGTDEDGAEVTKVGLRPESIQSIDPEDMQQQWADIAATTAERAFQYAQAASDGELSDDQARAKANYGLETLSYTVEQARKSGEELARQFDREDLVQDEAAGDAGEAEAPAQ